MVNMSLKRRLIEFLGIRRPLKRAYDSLPQQAAVLDVGCLNFVQVQVAQERGRHDLLHYGVDYGDLASEAPLEFVYKRCDLAKENIPFPDDSFDLVVASHVIEHLADPLRLFEECIRVCKPGGEIYIEAPSERSVNFRSMPFGLEKMYCASFYDDPTHLGRPWTPQALFRLASYYGCWVVKTGYYQSAILWVLSPFLLLFAFAMRRAKLYEFIIWNAFGWACFSIIEKPKTVFGRPIFSYAIPPRD